MKVTTQENKSRPEIEIPCLMYNEASGNVILVSKEGTHSYSGMVLARMKENMGYPVGELRYDWIKTAFSLWSGKVTLSN